jgi:hypothetical protein
MCFPRAFVSTEARPQRFIVPQIQTAACCVPYSDLHSLSLIRPVAPYQMNSL